MLIDLFIKRENRISHYQDISKVDFINVLEIYDYNVSIENNALFHILK